MMKHRVALLFGLLFVVCLSVSNVRAEEEPKAEPEAAAEPEAEPEHHHDEDSKQAGSSVSKSGEAKAATGKNPASAPWAFSVPAIIALSAFAKFVL